MKTERVIVLAAIIVMCCIAICCIISCSRKSYKEATIEIFGEEVEMKGVTVVKQNGGDNEYCELPLIEVLHKLEAEIEWQNENEAIINYGSEKMYLSLSQKTLFEDKSGPNYLTDIAGNMHHCCEVVDGDVVVDGNTMSYVCYELSMQISLTIDYTQGIVRISAR